MHDDLGRFEMCPHWMSRICKVALQQRVCKEKLAEFIGYVRLGNGQNRKDGCARRDSSTSYYENTKLFSLRELIAVPFDVRKPFETEVRYRKSKNQ